MSTKAEKPDTLKSLKVRAIEAGYFGDGPMGMIYRNVNDVFTITPREMPLLNVAGKAELDSAGKLKTKTLSVEDQLGSWMEIVDPNEPERITTAQQEINKQIAELNSSGRIPGHEAA